MRLGLTIRRGFRDGYDNLGYVVFATLISFFLTAIACSVVAVVVRAAGKLLLPIQILLAMPVAFVVWLCAIAVYYYVNKTVFHQHPVWADMLTGIRKLFRPGLGLFAIDLIITLVLLGDAVFFLKMMNGLPFTLMGILCAYLTLVWGMMAMYHLPLLVAQLDMESGPKPGVVLRKSFLLVADNPGFTVAVFLVIIAFAVLCALPAFIGMAVLFLGFSAFLLTHALRELFIRYGIVEDDPEVVDDGKWQLPESWRKRDGSDEDDCNLTANADTNK